MTQYFSKNFSPKGTQEENLSEANRWFDKALKLEDEGKSANMVDMALHKACDYESAAYA